MTKILRLPKKQSLLLLAIFAVHGLFAQTIRYVNASLTSGLNNGTSWDNAYKDLQPAIAAAQTSDQIWVAKGTYYPTTSTTDRTASFVMKNNLAIYGGFAGTETTLSQRDWKNNVTTLSGDIDHATDPLVVTGSGSTLSITGNAGNSYNVVFNYYNSLTQTATLDGFAIVGGYGVGGSGMSNTSVSPNLANLVFRANYAASIGGGIYNDQSAPTISNVVFSQNMAVSGGGGMYNSNGASTPNIVNVIFYGNSASSGNGGGMLNKNVSYNTLSLVNCIFLNNYAKGTGGVMYNDNSTPGLKNSILWNNSDGISNQNSSNATITYSNIQGGYTGTGNINQDPQFINAANPAGTDGIFGTADDGLALLPCSPSINTGSNAAIPSGTITDITGANRIQGSAVDMGTYEFTGSNNGNPTSADFMAVNADVSNTNVTSGQTITLMVDGSSCKSIATLQSTGVSPVNGNITAKVWVDANVQADATGKPYLQRHYQIIPANNVATATATATVTLYFLQSEFTAYNATANVANGIYPKLPIDITDAANNRNNLKLIKIGGSSSDGSGAPNTYNGAATLIAPTSVVYNNSSSRWEATFSVVGFSGFFGTTGNTVLPVSWISVTATLSAQQQAQISWQVSEVNVASYSIERSTDGINFSTIGKVNSKGDATNSYSFADASLAQVGVAFYRIKQTDKDGKIGYSAIVQLTTIDRQIFSIYPNPAKNILYVATSGIKGDVQIVDVVGHVLTSVTITGNKTEIDITRLAIGTYYCKAGGKSILFVKE